MEADLCEGVVATSFVSMRASCMTMFKIALLESWDEIFEAAVVSQPAVAVLLFIYMMSVSLGVLNAVIGVISQRTIAAAQDLENAREGQLKRKRMADIMRLADDIFQGDRSLTLSEMEDIAGKHDGFFTALRSLDLPPGFDVASLHRIFDWDVDGHIVKDDFINGMFRLTQNNPFHHNVCMLLAVAEVKQICHKHFTDVNSKLHAVSGHFETLDRRPTACDISKERNLLSQDASPLDVAVQTLQLAQEAVPLDVQCDTTFVEIDVSAVGETFPVKELKVELEVELPDVVDDDVLLNPRELLTATRFSQAHLWKDGSAPREILGVVYGEALQRQEIAQHSSQWQSREVHSQKHRREIHSERLRTRVPATRKVFETPQDLSLHLPLFQRDSTLWKDALVSAKPLRGMARSASETTLVVPDSAFAVLDDVDRCRQRHQRERSRSNA